MSLTTNGCHLFTVKEYSRLVKEMDEGSFISSDTFRVGGYDWEVRFFPHGRRNTTDTGRALVIVSLMSDCTDVKASFEFILLDQSGNCKHRSLGSGGIKLHTYIKGWGCWVTRDLESSNYVADDSLTFHCMVAVIQSCCIRPNNFAVIPPPPGIEKDVKYLLDSEIGSDIVFRVKDVTFKAHKAILAARSPVFKAQFYGLLGNPALDEVEVMDMEPLVFKAMLLFIYSDKLPDSQESMGSMSNMIQNLLVAADLYGLDPLKQLCEAKLCEELNVDVAATTLSLAHDHHCSQLKAFCMDFILANLRGVIQTEGYRYVEKSCPLLLLELLPKMAEFHRNTSSEI